MRVTVVGLALLLVVACNGKTTGTPPSTIPTSTTDAPTTTHPPPPPPFEEVTVELSDDGYLVDPEGLSLYLFTLDTERSSSCEGDCAEAWPPLLGDPVAGEGVEQDLLGNAERGNGAIQVTYDGWPLYRHSGDSAPGDTNGHGFNGVWFLVGSDGEPLDS